jgi:hypothetical protein
MYKYDRSRITKELTGELISWLLFFKIREAVEDAASPRVLFARQF